MSKYSQVRDAMDIFVKYKDEFIEADHDIIYGISTNTEITDEDKATLDELGWVESDEYDCWCCFC